MTLGNVVALVQKNIKRLLAYSSGAQAGYTVEIGVAALPGDHDFQGQEQAVPGAFYMFMYTFTNLLAFGIIILFTETTGSDTVLTSRQAEQAQPDAGARHDGGAAVALAGRRAPGGRASSASSSCSRRRSIPIWSGWR
ncbi:MAG: proton-conducting transporter membrane subunit [Anaerolineae bacterium]